MGHVSRGSVLHIALFRKHFGVLLVMEKLKDKFRAIFSSRGCLGCCTKSLLTSVDELTKGLRIRRCRVKRHNTAKDFWSSSPCEMDNSAFPSERSLSSISTLNQTTDPHSNTGSSSDPPEFANHGLYLWNQTRQQWIGNKSSLKQKQTQEPKLCEDATYESLLGSNKPFPQPIPLSEMVDFLVDIWEQEGLYD